MIYSPKGTFKGVNEQLSQHIDIYPTLVDLVDYDKPFRSGDKASFQTRYKRPMLWIFLERIILSWTINTS